MTTLAERIENVDEAAQACLDVYRHCTASAQHCLNVRREDRLRRCAGSLGDAADASLLLGNLLLRRSAMVGQAMVLCTEATRQAASSIAGLEHADGQLRATYAACQNLLRVMKGLSGDAADAQEDDRDEALEETFPASDATPTVSHAT